MINQNRATARGWLVTSAESSTVTCRGTFRTQSNSSDRTFCENS